MALAIARVSILFARIIMKTSFLLSLGAILISVVFVLSDRTPVAIDDSKDLHDRIVALEDRVESLAANATPEPIPVTLRDQPKVIQNNGIAAHNRLVARIDRLESQFSAFTSNPGQAPIEHYGFDAETLINNDNLDYSLEILDRAEATGLLDQEMQDELNQALPAMEQASNKQFWERLFAAMDAGTIEQLPEVDLHDDGGWPQAEQALEVTGDD